MDIVFPYKRSPDDFELRYSLRSLVNVPHSRVIIAGDHPSVVNESLTVIKNPRTGTDRYVLSTSNIFAAINRVDVSDQFLVFNDDFFILKPWTFQHEHRDTIEGVLTDSDVQGDYRHRIVQTRSLLRSVGVTDPLFFGLHTPTKYDRQKLVDMMREYPMPKYKYLLRTLYHNLYQQPSVQRADVKVKSWPVDEIASDALSISDNVASDPAFKTWINERFPNPSVYEVTT